MKARLLDDYGQTLKLGKDDATNQLLDRELMSLGFVSDPQREPMSFTASLSVQPQLVSA